MIKDFTIGKYEFKYTADFTSPENIEAGRLIIEVRSRYQPEVITESTAIAGEDFDMNPIVYVGYLGRKLVGGVGLYGIKKLNDREISAYVMPAFPELPLQDEVNLMVQVGDYLLNNNIGDYTLKFMQFYYYGGRKGNRMTEQDVYLKTIRDTFSSSNLKITTEPDPRLKDRVKITLQK